MIRTYVLPALLALNVTGCGTMAAVQTANQEQERALQARIDQLSPEQRDKVGQCAAVAKGKMETLRASGQGGLEYAWIDELAIAGHCLDNPYYYASIPSPAPPSPRPITCDTMMYGQVMATTTCN